MIVMLIWIFVAAGQSLEHFKLAVKQWRRNRGAGLPVQALRADSSTGGFTDGAPLARPQEGQSQVCILQLDFQKGGVSGLKELVSVSHSGNTVNNQRCCISHHLRI